jgi:DNA-binding IclR family transcriptional regulator
MKTHGGPALATGAKTVEKAARLLIELSRRSNGWRLTDLARESSIDLATAHRLLRCLSEFGLVARRSGDRHFVVGPEALNLGLAAAYQRQLVDLARTVAREIATETRLAGFVYLRSGDDFVCIARAGGTQVKGLSIQVGTRRPLIGSAGGVAILLKLDPKSRRAIVDANLARIRSVGQMRVRGVSKMLARSVEAGYGLNRDDVLPGISSVGVGLALPPPWTHASVLVSGATESMPDAHLPRVLSVVTAAANRFRALIPDAF